MLPADEFTFAEWKAAQGQPKSTPVLLPQSVTSALAALQKACREAGIPHVTVFGLQGGDAEVSDLLVKPENVSHAMLLARSAVVADPAHKMALMAHSLQSLDLSKFQL